VIDAIVAERKKNGPFKTIYGFCERLNCRVVNKAAIESLIKCGAFDSVHTARNRAAMHASLDEAIAASQRAADDLRSGQMNFFAAMQAEAPDVKIERDLPSVAPWDQRTTLAGEKEVLGFHVSGHPLDQHHDMIRAFSTTTIEAIPKFKDETPVIIGAQVARIRFTFVKTGKSAGQKMAMVTIQDKSGSIDGVVFSDAFAKFGSLLQDGAVLMFIGRTDLKRGEPQIIIEQLVRVQDAPQFLSGRIELELFDDPQGDPIESQMQMVAGLLHQAAAAKYAEGGRAADVFVHICCDGRRHTLKLNRTRVIAEPLVLQRLRETVGVNHVRVVSAGPPRPRFESGNGSNGNGAKRWQQQPQTAEA
jgi:DNA polymerase III subunit alpha